MKFVELKKSLSKGHDACYLLTGDDPFVIDSALKTFEQMCALPEMNIQRLTSPTASDIVVAASVFPFMSPIRLVVVEGFTKSAEELKAYLSSPAPDTVIVIVSGELTANLGELKSVMTVVDCSRQDAGVITSYIARECNNAGVNITSPAAKSLIDRCGRNMTRISVELKKLIAYKSGGLIETTDVENLVEADLDYKVFDLSDCLASKNGERALTILDDMLSGSSSSANVFGIIYSHFRKLLYLSISQNDEEARSCLNLSDYPYKKLKSQVRNFSPKRLKRICDELHKVDSDYRSGYIDDKLAIKAFAMRVVNEGK